MAETAQQFALKYDQVCSAVRSLAGGVVRRSASFVLLFLLFVSAFASQASAQQIDTGANGSETGDLEIVTTQEEGFGRIILNFKGRNLLPGYSIKQDNSIFVIRFDEAVNSSPVTNLPLSFRTISRLRVLIRTGRAFALP